MQKPILWALPAVLTMALSGQSLTSISEVAQPNAKILAGIDVRSLRESYIAKSGVQDAWIGQLRSTGLEMAHFPGLEILNDIDSVFISSTGEKPQSSPSVPPSKAAPSVKTNLSFVAVLRGTFPPAHYQAMLQGPKRTFRNLAVYKASKSGDTALAVVDEHTLVIGDEKSVFGALDRLGRAPAVSAELVNRASALSGHDIWVVISDLGSAIPSPAGANNAVAAQFASQIDAMEIGVSLKQGLLLNLNLVAKTEATVQFLAGMLNTQTQMMAAQPDANPQAADVLKKMSFSAQGNRLSVALSLTQEELDQQIRAAQSARMTADGLRTRVPATASASAAPAPALSSAPVAPPKPPEPQGPRKVRIFGLDDGVREIPLDR